MAEIEIRAEIDDEDLLALMAKAPHIAERSIERYLSRGAMEVTNEARSLAPKAASGLVNSILADRISPFEYRVGPHVDYGGYVEKGFGAAHSRVMSQRKYQGLIDWIRAKHISPNDPKMDDVDLAVLIGRSLARRGRSPQPYLRPAAENKQSRVFELVWGGLRRDFAREGLL